jgi:hypothetical protein
MWNNLQRLREKANRWASLFSGCFAVTGETLHIRTHVLRLDQSEERAKPAKTPRSSRMQREGQNARPNSLLGGLGVLATLA